MATHSLAFTPTNHLNYDAPKNTLWQNTGVTTTAITQEANHTYSLNSITLNVSSAKYYVSAGYFEIQNQNGTIIGRTKEFNTANGEVPLVQGDGQQNPSNVTFTLINCDLDAALAMTTFKMYNRRDSSSGGNLCNIRSGATLTLIIDYNDTLNTSDCNNPNSVTVSRVRNVVTISWSGATGGTNNAISGYQIAYNTSPADSGAVGIGTVSTGAGSGNTTHAQSVGTYYYGVRTLGSVSGFDSSTFAWSSSIYIPTRPAVSRGDPITKETMDALRSYINIGSTEVTQGGSITETIGDTYSDVTQGGSIDASWYNNA